MLTRTTASALTLCAFGLGSTALAAPAPQVAPAPRTAAPRAAAPQPASAAALPLRGIVIAVDAGHNGGNVSHPSIINALVPAGFGLKKACNTVGTATAGGYSEHAHNFDVAVRLASLLRAKGATVVMTRTSDTGVGPCITTRAARINASRAHVTISIHADGNLSQRARGFHVISSTRMAGGAGAVAASARLATTIRNGFGSATPMPRSTYIGKGTALSRRGDLGGLNLAKGATVLVEAGNMRQTSDARLLTSVSFRQREAQGILNGIRAYLKR